jgi:RNA polymerase sigma-54 factor
MAKLSLIQSLQQKLSPQQIQFIKLLQIPVTELESRIEEELEINPALEEGKEETPENEQDSNDDFDAEDSFSESEEIQVEDYMRDDDIAGYKMQGDGPTDEDDREMPLSFSQTLLDNLKDQLGFLRLSETEQLIGLQLIGSIDEDGYIRREMDQVANDLAFAHSIEVSGDEIEAVLYKIQSFDPAGIAARNLQECLHLQIERKDHELVEVFLADHIVLDHFEEFTKKHYDKIQKKLDCGDEDFKKAIELITHLNPKPGGGVNDAERQIYLIPDFFLHNINGTLEITLNSKNAPELRVSQSYKELFQTYDQSSKTDKKLKEAVTFVKQKLDAAKWFIDAIQQRQNTLMRVMGSILKFQYEFFLEGDESRLRPMILKDIADDILMDISTVSRVANSKSIQTEFGVFPLKYFFSEGIATTSGEDASSREVKHILKTIIEAEEKRKPLSDERLEKELHLKGYTIARRTVAKYREQLNIPVARLRKEL